jgi:hypothetical protein
MKIDHLKRAERPPTTTISHHRSIDTTSIVISDLRFSHHRLRNSNNNNNNPHVAMSFFAEIMQPGGGIILIPFVRVIITVLLVCTMMGFVAGVARIHMAVLSFLSGGLLFSLSMFEREFHKVHGRSSSSTAAPTTTSNSNKTD